MAEQKLRVNLLLDSDKFAGGLRKAEGSLKGFGGKVSSIGKGLATRLTLPLGIAGGAAIKMAASFNESLSKVDVTFKSSSKQVKDFAKTTLTQFGIAQGTALDMAGLFGDMSTSMGLTTAEAAKMSTSLVGLAGDLSSFKDMNIEEVTTALNGVFTGETESLKRLGIVMTEVNLQNFAMEKGITKNIKKMTQAEKVNLRYQYVMSKTVNAQGDFARTSDSAANQMRNFQGNLKELGTTFGQIVLPAFTKIVTKANGLITAFKNMSPQAKELAVQIALFAASLPIVITAFGYLATALGALISPIGLFVAGLGAVIYFFDDIANAFILFQSNVKTYILNTLIRIDEFVQKYLVEPFKFAIKAINGFLDEGLSFDFTSAWEETTKKQDKISEDASKKIADNTVNNLTNAFSKMKTGRVKNALNNALGSVFGGLTTGGGQGRSEQSVSAISAVDFKGLQSEGFGITAESTAESVNVLKGALQNLNTQITYNKTKQDEYKESLEQAKANFEQLGQTVTGVLEESFTALMDGGNFFEPIIQSLKKLVVRLLAAAAAAALLSVLMPGSSATAGGFSAMFGKFSGLGDTVAFANGGIVSGPTLGLVGEYSGARSNPEVIAPLDKLKGMIGDRSQNVNVGGQFKVQGQDLVLALQRADKNRNRIL